MTIEMLKNKANHLPDSAGVYLMKNSDGKIIYVGKAKNLKNRVANYFLNNYSHSKKTRELVSHIDDFEFLTVETDFEAYCLECIKIKEYRPQYNIQLNDDSGFHYIVVQGFFPKIKATTKPIENTDNIVTGIALGPFTGSYATSALIEETNLVFKLPVCNKDFSVEFKPSRPCLNFHTKQCCGVCTGKIDRENYIKTVNEALDYIKNGSNATIEKLTVQMTEYSENLEFEKAAILRDRIKLIKRSWDEQKIVENFSQEKSYEERALTELKNILGLENLPVFIESYDISNLGNSEIVAGMVVYENAKPKKSAYKKFKMKTVEKQNDYASMQEVLQRRFKHFLDENEKDPNLRQKPDLIFVDGGKGQVSVSKKILLEMGIDIPIFGLVKDGKHRTRAISSDTKEIVVSQAFNLITRIQDETHRFTISYQRKRRDIVSGIPSTKKKKSKTNEKNSEKNE